MNGRGDDKFFGKTPGPADRPAWLDWFYSGQRPIMGDRKQVASFAIGTPNEDRVTLVRLQELPFPFVWTIHLRILDGKDQLPVDIPGVYCWPVNFGVQNGVIETVLSGGTHTVFGDSLLIQSPRGADVVTYLRNPVSPWYVAAVTPNFGGVVGWDEYVS